MSTYNNVGTISTRVNLTREKRGIHKWQYFLSQLLFESKEPQSIRVTLCRRVWSIRPNPEGRMIENRKAEFY